MKQRKRISYSEPTTFGRLDQRLNLRCDEEFVNRLKALSEDYGITKGGIIRLCVTERKYRSQITSEDALLDSVERELQAVIDSGISETIRDKLYHSVDVLNKFKSNYWQPYKKKEDKKHDV